LAQANYPAMDLVQPEVDFVALARAFGVEAHRVAEPDDLSERVREALARTEPLLLDVPIER
jgi:benzoylformate decarboxylase